MSKKANSMTRRRILFAAAVLGVGAFVIVAGRLFQLQVLNYEFYEEKAIAQQTKDTTIEPMRGTIYDCNMKPLAISASVEMVTLEPRKIADDEQAQIISQNLAEILDMDYETVYAKASKTDSAYEVIKRGVEKEVADEVRQFKSDYNEKIKEYNEGKPEGQQKEAITSIYMAPDTKRYYPFGNFAAQVLGFVGSDNQGLAGIEAKYDSYLTGTPGRAIRATNANGEEMPFDYEMYYEAEDGNDIVLTIDEVIQHYLEKNLEIAAYDNNTQNQVAGIVMDVDTGAILGMATEGDFDPNDPFTITDEQKAQELAAITDEEEYSKKRNEILQAQWRNKAVTDTYDPGSTFKILTASMALEEKAITVDSTFYCPGYRMVEGWPQPIKCWYYPRAHGSQNLYQAIQNSCNPAFIDIGQAVGAKTFLGYYKAFGLDEPTGIDLPSEGKSIFHSEEQFLSNKVDLATASFGQNFQISPLQLITAVSAVANGGNLMKPYIVKEILDGDGNIVESTEPTVVRQVISEETSELMCDILETVVSEGTGKNAYVAGYHIAGKTGTSEKKAKQAETGRNDLRISSFIAFAPADDPQVAVLVILDEPTVQPVTGGITAAPVIRRIMSDILPYLGVEPTYTAEELEEKDVSVPEVIGMTKTEAESALSKVDLDYRVVGDGDTVTDQLPSYGSAIPGGSQVVLYMGAEKPTEPVQVPNVAGLSVSAARAQLERAGLYMKGSGAVSSSGNVVASKQNITGTAAMGTVVTVEFTDLDQRAE